MAKVASAEIELSARTAKLESDLAKVERKVKRFGTRSQSTFNKLAESGRAAFRGISIAGGVATTALSGVSIAAARSADELAKTADKLGVGTKQLAGLQLAAKLTGVETNKLNLGLQRMTRRVAEAARGTGEAQGALRELGLDAEKLNKLSPDEQFKRIGDALSQVGNQSDKVRLGFKLFDSEGVDLIRTLNLQREGLERAQKEAEAFGTALSRVDAKQIEIARDQLERARQAIKGIGTTVAVQASAFIGTFSKAFADAAVDANGFKDEIGGAMEALAVGVGLVANSIKGIQVALLGAKAALLEIKRDSAAQDGVTGRIFNFGADLIGQPNLLQGQEQTAIDQLDATFARIEQLTGSFRSVDEIRQFYRSAIEEARGQAQAQLDAANIGATGFVPDGSAGTLDYDPENDPILKAARKRNQELQRLERERQRQEEQRRRLDVQLETRAESQKLAVRQAFTNSAVGLLQTLGARSKKLQIASIVVEKALAIKRALIQSKTASIYAFASQLIPGDPSSFVRALAAKKATLALGAGTALAIGASGVAQIAQVSSGDAFLGSAANPVFTSAVGQSAIDDTLSSSPRNVTSITIQGDLVGNSAELILEELRDKLENEDEILFSSTSRQALEVTGG